MNDTDRGSIAGGLIAGIALLVSLPAESAAPSGAVMPGAPIVLASHKALYAVTMTSARVGGEYLDVSGRMLMQFTDACDVWSTKQKSLLRTLLADGTEERSSSDFTSRESKAGDSYDFSVRQTDGGSVTEFRGSAKRNGPNGSGTADYTKPEKATYKLSPRFFFQTGQQLRLISDAQKGTRFFSGTLFDGSEGYGAAQFNAVILNGQPSSDHHGINDPLVSGPAHRVRIAFFPPEGSSKDDVGSKAADTGEQPEYEMTMTLHDNGVVSEYDYNYDEFSVHGQLEAIEALPKPHC